MSTTTCPHQTFWDKRSGQYDENIRKHDSLYDRTIERTGSLLTHSDVVLDFACASGEISMDIAPGVQQIQGIDLSAKMIALALDAAFSFSTAPIRLARQIGTLTVLVGVLYFCYILVRYFLIGDFVAGWSSLICSLLILGGMQLVFTGLIGEYLARVFDETKRRPLYIFKQQPQTDGSRHGGAILSVQMSDLAAGTRVSEASL